jgi:hypothetical protein
MSRNEGFYGHELEAKYLCPPSHLQVIDAWSALALGAYVVLWTYTSYRLLWKHDMSRGCSGSAASDTQS